MRLSMFTAAAVMAIATLTNAVPVHSMTDVDADLEVSDVRDQCNKLWEAMDEVVKLQTRI